jgi:hypothetical protein
MAFMGMASRSEVVGTLERMGDWRAAGCELSVRSRGFGPLSGHEVTVLTPEEGEGDGWMVRGLMLVELSYLRRFRNVIYRIRTTPTRKR